MGKPKPIRLSAPSAPRAEGVRAASVDRAPWGEATQGRGTRMLALVLSALLAVTMLPAAGLQTAYADEPVERPATSGGDVALQSANGDADAGTTSAASPVAEEREGGILAAGGLLYTVADGGLALVGFDEGASLRGALAVPAAVSVDGRDVAVVAVDLAEGSVAEGVTALSVPQSVDNVKVNTLASAFPGLLSVEVAAVQGSSLPVAAGAAALRATYSSFGGALLGQATVEVEGEGGSVEAVQCRELLWAPPAAVAVRLPVDCLSIAPGAFADAKSLETIVCFGDVQRIAAAERDEAGNVTQQGALTDDQLEAVTVVFPDATPAVPSEGDGRVSASMALNDGATQTDKRHAWVALGLPLDRLSMGKPVGALTETVAVTEDGAPASESAQLISYPGMHPKATDVKHPDESGVIDMADNGLAYEMKSDMTLSVRWQGDPTATPSRLEIPATVAIDGVTYPVTEIAPEAFKGAVFLESVTIPDGVTVIGKAAFEGCANLRESDLSSVFGTAHAAASRETIISGENSSSGISETGNAATIDELMFAGSDHDRSIGAVRDGSTANSSAADLAYDDGGTGDSAETSITPYVTSVKTLTLYVTPALARSLTASNAQNVTYGVVNDSILNVTYTGSESLISWHPITFNGQLEVYVNTKNGARVGQLYFLPPAQRAFISCSVDGASSGTETAGRGDIAFSVLGWSNLLGSNAPLTTASFAGTGSALTAARSDHNHDSTYAKLADFNALKTTVGNKLDSSAISSYNTNAKLDAKFNTKVDASDFGTITYSGLDEGDASVYPTSYRKGGAPALPEPKREGHAFLGWTWGGQDEPTTDREAVKGAFAAGGAVALTANWGAPAADYFFTESAPCQAAGGEQSHTIAVRLASEHKSLSSVTFSKKDESPLGANADAIRFRVGDGAAVGWGASAGTCDLVELPGGGWGVYVTVTVPAGAIDEAKVVSSYVESSYVSALAKMSYAFA